MIFLIERDLSAAADRFAAVAKAAGHRVLRWSDGEPVPAVADVFLGALGSCAAVPGVIGDPARLAVRHWLPGVADLALNAEVVEATVGNLPLIPWPSAFVRPDCCLKPFSGRLVAREALSPAALDHGFYFDDLDLPVLLSPPQAVAAEWRFVAVDRRVVAHSGYLASREAVASEPPAAAEALAREAARRAPEPTVVIDICQLASGAFQLVEYNLFSGADLYGCDLGSVVVALTAWLTPA